MKRVIQYFFLSLLIVGIQSCSSLVDDLNDDPNNPTDANVNLILVSAQLADITIHEAHVARVAGLWSGYFTGVGRQYADIYVYNIGASSFSQIWSNIYYGVVQQSNVILEKSEGVNNQIMIGIVKVLKAHALGAGATGWGDIPFTEAGQVEFENPQFDEQEDVFAGLQGLLDEAITSLETGIGSAPTDIFFGGNAAAWIEVAYTLKARFYLQTRQYALAYAAAGNGISSQANSMMAPHGNTNSANENTLYTFVARSRAGDMNSEDAYLVKLLDPSSPDYRGDAKTNEEARYNFNFTAPLFTAGTEPNTQPGGFAAQTASFPLVTYSENLLILAEAGARTDFDTGLGHLNDYRAFLNSGGYLTTVTGALDYQPYVTTDFQAGGMASVAGFTQDESLLQEILEERYVTFFGQILGFNDMNRTRKETVGIKLTPNSGTEIPHRFIYGQEEINSNVNIPSPVPGIFTPTPINE
ncbi:MAG: SusD/RagB family nutrient-binding outer membrane lipoprotein [Cyclobacteriaceae bacterium]|nr:SusD/RagB family nutrient-binding outer membrane lipoprotein [Cyclobacteriaceae bacterium SS2]